jgi:hypothetical protein
MGLVVVHKQHAALAVPELAAACVRGDAVLFATAHPAKFEAATPALRGASA